MGDIAKPFAQWVANNIPLSVGIAIFLFCLFFEISKVKVYPLKWLWKAISWPLRKIDEQRTASFKRIVENFQSNFDEKLTGLENTFNNNLTEMATAQNANCAAVKSCFGELETRFDALDEKQKETEEKLDKLAAARIKNHVLNFARQCRKGEPHSIEDFRNLVREHENYCLLVSKYNWVNDVYTEDYEYIMRVYRHCLDANDFLR